MEDDTVVELLACELLDALHVLWGEIGTQLDHHLAFRGVDDQRVLGILVGHFDAPLLGSGDSGEWGTGSWEAGALPAFLSLTFYPTADRL